MHCFIDIAGVKNTFRPRVLLYKDEFAIALHNKLKDLNLFGLLG